MWPNGTSELILDAIVYTRALLSLRRSRANSTYPKRQLRGNAPTTTISTQGIPPDLPSDNYWDNQSELDFSIGDIVGITIGGVIFVIIVILVICFRKRISGWCRGLRTPPPAMVVQDVSLPPYQVHEEKSRA
ncbi:hypothetical protein AN958_01103 [Leucoagaricus sp. SymC.cos]|nr:hypothetical protein AN958_01103 [Leucoagaricus sp. SymC.cos]